MIYLAEIDGYDLGASSVETLFFSSGLGYTDAINGQYYEPRIEQPALLSREMVNDLKIYGRSNAGYGELTLVNIDGGLDWLNGYAFDGRRIVIKVGDEEAYIFSFSTVFIGTLTQAAVEYERVSFRIKDRQADLDKPLQTLVYAGNNALPNGLEGDISLAGRIKPWLFGICYNVSPILVNTSRLIYQVSTDVLANLTAVYDKGVQLTYGGDYTDQTDMETNAPAAGQYKRWLAGGMFRLGSSAAGAITCDAWGNSTVSLCVQDIVTSANGIDIADTVSTDYDIYTNPIMAQIVGLYVDEAINISEALDQFCSSLGLVWWFDNLGRFRIKQLESPAVDTPVFTLTDVEILSIEQQQAAINSQFSPVWRLQMGYEKNWTIQTKEQLAGSVTDARAEWLAQEFRYVEESLSSIKTAFILAQELTFNAAYSSSSQATVQAALLFDFLQLRSYFYTVTVLSNANLSSLLDLNAVVTVQVNRFGLNTGLLMRIVGVKTDYQRNQIDLVLWGVP